jgi:hypothetical protein
LEKSISCGNIQKDMDFNFQNYDQANFSSLKKIATFILTIKKRHGMIYSDSTYEIRSFIPLNDRHYFSQSITTNKEGETLTTSKIRVSEFVEVEPRTPARQRSVLGTPSLEESFIITESSLKESGIYRKCSLYFTILKVCCLYLKMVNALGWNYSNGQFGFIN